MYREFGENADGVHLMNGEYSLCGDAFDVGSGGLPGDEETDIVQTSKRTVTCPRCINIIRICRGVRTQEPTHD